MLRATTCLGANTEPILRDVVASLRGNGIDIEFDETLDWSEREEQFARGDMDLVWACGLLTAQTASRSGMTVVAAPVFDGQTHPVYRSVIVHQTSSGLTRVDPTHAGRVAINEYGSWSGYVGFRRWLDENAMSIDDFATTVISGSHHHSMCAVRDGSADVAAIDHTIWDARDRTIFGDLSVLDTTGDWPAPPISVSARAAELGQAVRESDAFRFVEASIADYQFML